MLFAKEYWDNILRRTSKAITVLDSIRGIDKFYDDYLYSLFKAVSALGMILQIDPD